MAKPRTAEDRRYEAERRRNTAAIFLRMTHRERDAVALAAEAEGLSLNQYCRRAVNDASRSFLLALKAEEHGGDE